MSLRRGPLALLALLLACGGRGEPGTPVKGPPAAPAAALAEPVDEAPEAAWTPIGWWRGESVCLELFANGDFEISVQMTGPKVLIFGGAEVTATGTDTYLLELTVAKIWKGRYLSSCRKIHEHGQWTDSQTALDVVFTPGNKAALTLRRIDDATVELCGKRCETLRDELPALRGRWRRAGLDNLSRPEPPWAPGDLLELEIAGDASHVLAGGPGTQWATAHGHGAAVADDDDGFQVTFMPRSFADGVPGTVPALNGEPLTLNRRRILAVRRLAGEKLEACDGAHCSVLERQFDSDDYEVK